MAILKQARSGQKANVARQFQRAVSPAGLDQSKITSHTKRQTAITKLMTAGVDLPTIQRIGDRETLSTILRYVHLHSAHVDEAVAKLKSLS